MANFSQSKSGGSYINMDRYGCKNCTAYGRFGCNRGNDGCQLTVMIAEQIAEPGKIDKFLAVLQAFHMTIRTSGNAFRVVTI